MRWIFGFLLVLTINNCLSQSAPQSRPNIILFIADDVSWDDLGCYGNPDVQTPVIDALARDGLLFTNAYLTTSSCSPSRCSMVAGRYPHNTGAPELHMPLPADQITFPALLQAADYHTIQAGKFHMGAAVKPAFDDCREVLDGGPGGEGQWVSTLQQRPRDKPFFAWFASLDAHRSWQVSDEERLHDAASLTVPEIFVDDTTTRQDLAMYYDEISRFDRSIGEVVEELRAQSILQNTCLLIIADNGRPFPRCKTRMYDSGIKTPMVVSWPAKIKFGARCDALVSTVDFASTILDIAGLESSEYFQGKSFESLLKDPGQDFRKYAFAEHNWHDYEAHERMVVSGQYLLVRNSRPQFALGGPADSKRSPAHSRLLAAFENESLTTNQKDIFQIPRPTVELFDLREDPHQFENLADDPGHKNTLRNLQAALDLWIEGTLDDVPENLTPDYFDRRTGLPLDGSGRPTVRGQMPGAKLGAERAVGKPGF